MKATVETAAGSNDSREPAAYPCTAAVANTLAEKLTQTGPNLGTSPVLSAAA